METRNEHQQQHINTSAPTGAQPQTTEGQEPRGSGRPILCVASLLDEMLAIIRERGLSDSAAAVHCGVSASSLSRWEGYHPILRIRLAAAREECRSDLTAREGILQRKPEIYREAALQNRRRRLR